MFILLLTFLGTYEWYPVESGNVSKEVLESSVVESFGKNRLRKSFVKLDSDIFTGGCMVLLPKGYTVLEAPEGLKLMENYIEIDNFDRYSAIYESGKMEKKWNRLKRELIENIGGIHFGTPSLDALRKRLLPGDVSHPDKAADVSQAEEVQEIEYPKEVYYSFLLVGNHGKQVIIPVLLVLSPIDEIYKQIRKEMSEAKGGAK